MYDFQAFAAHLAEASGEVIKQYFRAPFSVSIKDDDSPVTIADKKAEEVMRELIMKEFPDHGIIGEEQAAHNPDARYTWVLDPIDGTLNFIAGGPIFVTLIALLEDGQPVLGAIHQPVLGELLLGTAREARMNGEKVRVRSCPKIADATLLTSDPYLVMQHQNFENFEALRKKVRIYRCWADGYGYLLLATGQIDIMVDPIMHFWDLAALIPIIQGAGGRITDYHGSDPIKGSSIVATAGAVHDEVIEILNR